MASEDWGQMRDYLARHKQEHLLLWLDKLTDDEKAQLYSDLRDLELEKVNKYYIEAQKMLSTNDEKKDARLQPLDQEICGSTARDSHATDRWRERGLDKVGRGEVGVLLLAGGQGTRLGVPYPKGMYDVGLPSHKTLYQIQAERILRLQQLAREKSGKPCIIPWYIMTSEYTGEMTLDFFAKHNYFNLDPKNIIVFEQNTLPCLTFDGKVLLAEKHRVARAPDGNGGLYAALAKNNVLDDMRKRGVACVHVYCVDNILVKMADPIFVGFCDEKGADCGAKVVRKSSSTEKVGVLCVLDGKYQVVEYSEISVETAEKRNPDGSLTYSAGNICNHYFTLSFLERLCQNHLDGLSHHIARKKIPFVDETGKKVSPSVPNGMKMEKFVFDVFQFSSNLAVLEVVREDEFSPLKNAPGAGKDTPATCRSALCDLHYRQLLAAGGVIVDENDTPIPLMPRSNGNGDDVECEISPLVSYSGEGLKSLVSGKRYKKQVLLELDLIQVNGPVLS